MKQSKEIIQFYREIDQWIKAGCLRNVVFQKSIGLCDSVTWWTGDDDLLESMTDELVEQFKAAGLDVRYPFGDDYIERSEERTMYQCPKRLQWIADRIADADEQERQQCI